VAVVASQILAGALALQLLHDEQYNMVSGNTAAAAISSITHKKTHHSSAAEHMTGSVQCDKHT
jgi:hypothetical protein